MKNFSIKIMITLLLSSVQAMSVYRSDGKRNENDKFNGFGHCDGSTAFRSGDMCRCNKDTFYVDVDNTEPRCYSNDVIRNKTSCDLRLLFGDKKEFSVGTRVEDITSIEVWDAINRKGFWNSEWKNELKKFVTKAGQNRIKMERKDAIFEGLLVRITFEILTIPRQPMFHCIIIKVKGKRSFPLTWESIFPCKKRPATTAETTTTKTSAITTTYTNTFPEATDPSKNNQESFIHPLIGSAVGFVALIIIMIIIIIIIKKKRKITRNKETSEKADGFNEESVYDEIIPNPTGMDGNNEGHYQELTVKYQNHETLYKSLDFAESSAYEITITGQTGLQVERHIYENNTMC